MSAEVGLELINRSFNGSGWHRPLMETVGDLTAAQAAWRPPGGLHTTWALVAHLAITKQYLLERVDGGQPSFPEGEASFPPGDPDDEAGWQALLAKLRTNHEALAARLAQMTAEERVQPLKGGRVPAELIVAVAAAHESYHTGQIVANRRLQGTWPPPESGA